jgi:hypothetical protein
LGNSKIFGKKILPRGIPVIIQKLYRKGLEPGSEQKVGAEIFLSKPAAREMSGNDPHFAQTLLCPSLFKKFAKEMGRNLFYCTLKLLLIADNQTATLFAPFYYSGCKCYFVHKNGSIFLL